MMFIGKKGFNLIEMMVVIAIIAILAAIITPSAFQATEKAKVARILSMSDVLRKACERHYEDTGIYPLELNIKDSPVNENPDPDHELSTSQTTDGWKGPYIQKPLNQHDNPFKDSIDVGNILDGCLGYTDGFDLDRDGADEVTGPGNFLFIASVPEYTAQKIDLRVDGPGGNWKTTGAVQWASNDMRIYLCGGF